MKIIGITATILFCWSMAYAKPGMIKGFSLTEIGVHRYDASETGAKTRAQEVVDALYNLGVRHINLHPRATMTGATGSIVVPMTPGFRRQMEEEAYLRLIKYIKSKGMTVGIRPTLFVVGPKGEFPYVETIGATEKKHWWHGNIQPADTENWFKTFRQYLDRYLVIAIAGKVEEFTIGAELYSMTVGIEDQWLKHPHGFPQEWLAILRDVKAKFKKAGVTCRVMYDINFTDAEIKGKNGRERGGEFARWRYRIVDLAKPTDPKEYVIWEAIVNFWKELDAVGIDNYCSLATVKDEIPKEWDKLVELLRLMASSHADQIDNGLNGIEKIVGERKDIIIKEIGFKSVEKGFILPFESDGKGPFSALHQAAAYEAIYRAFWKLDDEGNTWPWMRGLVWWDISMDKLIQGPQDKGFNPLEKELTEKVIKAYWLDKKK